MSFLEQLQRLTHQTVSLSPTAWTNCRAQVGYVYLLQKHYIDMFFIYINRTFARLRDC